ncbi:hypothetical protein PAL_GLEAN10001144 [Pteropus alecto]|uniref:Uncharacterized protein n=1 Tax=Pteropus alecto TaxID=9402 RepID=L5KWJ3_PTEAL|nr:hypothetical protein PAL_GLEAN10001144 [Pteropus alecto]
MIVPPGILERTGSLRVSPSRAGTKSGLRWGCSRSRRLRLGGLPYANSSGFLLEGQSSSEAEAAVEGKGQSARRQSDRPPLLTACGVEEAPLSAGQACREL